jgi:hypothetical protein
VINAAKAKELNDQVAEAIDRGAVPQHRGRPADARFLPGQDTSAKRSATARRAPAATATSSSAAAAPPGGARSSAGNCWCAR